MTSPLDRIRAAALALPEAEEALDDRATVFQVDGRPFAKLSSTMLHVLAIKEVFDDIDLAGDPDWTTVEDQIALGWELAAPRRLLEAGGR
ncbi:MmcQ/YjbR family DNA-binding protein [Sphingomonas bacterium]|uniref:MmcQ/YjbR family DNA-binding protein n=1 Tax=Sphingomonas bacterium TaxID=1895847 RepID=UPI0015764E30|nr:MmcQ/YjbR family DNA-binding protein [Sphingomonas bacterium]